MSAIPVQFDIVSLFNQRRERARQLRHEDTIPSSLEAAFDILHQLDPQWVWVLDDCGVITGVLVASPAHGMAVIWRISISPSASHVAPVRLLRVFLRDIRRRGMRGYMTVVNLNSSTQAQLARIIERSGGKVIESGMTMLASPLPKEGI